MNKFDVGNADVGIVNIYAVMSVMSLKNTTLPDSSFHS